jgi:hypothetical protein
MFMLMYLKRAYEVAEEQFLWRDPRDIPSELTRSEHRHAQRKSPDRVAAQRRTAAAVDRASMAISSDTL